MRYSIVATYQQSGS